MVEHIQKSDEHAEILDFHAELLHADGASKINVPTMNVEIKKLQKGMTLVKSQIDREEKQGTETAFEDALGSWLMKATPRFEALTANKEKMDAAFKDVAGFYGENKARADPEVFFKMIEEFARDMASCRKAIRMKEEKEEKAAAKAAEKEKRGAGGRGAQPRMRNL